MACVASYVSPRQFQFVRRKSTSKVRDLTFRRTCFPLTMSIYFQFLCQVKRFQLLDLLRFRWLFPSRLSPSLICIGLTLEGRKTGFKPSEAFCAHSLITALSSVRPTRSFSVSFAKGRAQRSQHHTRSPANVNPRQWTFEPPLPRSRSRCVLYSVSNRNLRTPEEELDFYLSYNLALSEPVVK